MRYEVIHDSGETPNRCTIAPLAGRADFLILPVRGRILPLGPLSSQLLLHHEGECLTRLRGTIEVAGIAAIDCVWPRLPGLLARISGSLPTLARIPDGFVTAYPRKSSLNAEPDGGLATIEALFASAAILGHWDPGILSRYYFGRQFVELNRERFRELGVGEAADPARYPVLDRGPRHSLQRRLDRGKRVHL
ncbi:MAG TPA: hypothetical protein VM598_13355 [Bdellovibrionota bacterium]|nr:hypothetical protein [Bdellovibrionota bacterium]